LLKEFSGKKSLVCESHLLCEVKLPCDLILILRCNPLVLEKRLAARKGYSRNKIAGNCLVEALDYCSLKAGENYSKGKILEIDFTKPSLERVLKALKSRKGDSVNWSKELLKGGFRKIIEAEEGI
jgi:broad-specificity NMP kinase